MQLRRSLGSLSILFGLFVLLLPVTALALPDGANQTDNCAFDKATQYKYETDGAVWEPSDPGIEFEFTYSDEGEVIDVTVPAGWTIVCAKVPQPDRGAGISHLIIVEDPDEETTTTTVDDTTTTTEDDPTTTTTVQEPTTTTVEATTTTVGETTTTESDDTTTTQVIDITPNTPDTLPFTGFESSPGLWVAGVIAIAAGAGLVWGARKEDLT